MTQHKAKTLTSTLEQQGRHEPDCQQPQPSSKFPMQGHFLPANLWPSSIMEQPANQQTQTEMSKDTHK